MEQQQQQQSSSQEPVHCFWALMTYGDLRFIYLSSSVQRAVSAKYKQLLGQSFFDYIHPDEAKLARKDLNAFMDVHNLYGSVTRCRFKNVCPEWQQRWQARQPGSAVSASVSAAALQAAASEGGLSSRGLGQKGLYTLDSGGDMYTTDAGTDSTSDKLSTLSVAAGVLDQENPSDKDLKNYKDIFQNGEEDEFMILDVVMNVVSDEVVLGFFHIDGQGLYKGFWSNGTCGESKESLPTLSPEIMRHLRDSVHDKRDRHDMSSSPTSSPRRSASDNRTKRIFQIYDSQDRSLLLTWPEPGPGSNDAGTLAYNPDLYTQIVQSHHIPTDALDNTTCLKRFCSKNALPNSSSQEPTYQVESVFIPYGHIIFACFQTSPTTPTNNRSLMASPAISSAVIQGSHVTSTSPGSRSFGSSYEAGSSGDHLSGLGLLSSPGQTSSALFGVGSNHGSPSSASNSPLVIPSLSSFSPFLKNAVAGQMTTATGQAPSPSLTGPIRNTGSHSSSSYHPYARSSATSNTSSESPSPSILPLPEGIQESLSFLHDHKAGEPDRGRGGSTSNERHNDSGQSMWHASTPHPAIAAMIGHSLAPSSPSFQRTVNGADSRSHGRQKPPTLAPPVELHFSGNERDTKARKLSPSPRHPAQDTAMQRKSPSSTLSSSPPATFHDMESTPGVSEQGTRASHGSAAGRGGHVLRVQQEEKACESCGTTNSPEWRRGQSGKKDLCNACGLRYSRSVARQQRQAQKQSEGKATKTKAPKPGKPTKASPKKVGGADTAALESSAASHSAQASQITLQDPLGSQQQQQQQQQQVAHAYPSTSYAGPSMVPTYSMTVQSSFYHGQ